MMSYEDNRNCVGAKMDINPVFDRIDKVLTGGK